MLRTLNTVPVKIKMYLETFVFTCFANTNNSYCLVPHVVVYPLSLSLNSGGCDGPRHNRRRF